MVAERLTGEWKWNNIKPESVFARKGSGDEGD